MSQLWKSRINTGMAPEAWSMNRSIDRDMVLLPYEIEGSKSHVRMLLHAGLISHDQAHALMQSLGEILEAQKRGELEVTPSDEDVHGFVERLLVEDLGAWASVIHMGRSRNEQVLLDEKLFLIDTASRLTSKLAWAVDCLETRAARAEDALVPSYTHLRRAQPMFLRQYWSAHAVLWKRTLDDLQALRRQIQRESPMGAGAINGTTLDTDPVYEASLLGFERPPLQALATVSSRGDLIRFAAIWTHWMLELSRLMEDLILWSSEEFGLIGFESDVTSGSSMMPQKRNPDICELLRGKSAVVMGYYTGLLALCKGLPMGYMKDLQEDKTLLMPLVAEVEAALDVVPVLLGAVIENRDAMRLAVSDAQLLATDVMEVLVSRGIPLREAHGAVADCIGESIQTGRAFASCARSRWDLPDDCFDALASCRKREMTCHPKVG